MSTPKIQILGGGIGGGGIDPTAYQLKTDKNLNTESKEIVGAINEINGKMPSKAIPALATSLTGNSTLAELVTLLRENGITAGDGCLIRGGAYPAFTDFIVRIGDPFAGDTLVTIYEWFIPSNPIPYTNTVSPSTTIAEVMTLMKRRLNTTDKTLVGAINELNSKLPKDSAIGTWLFNETITIFGTGDTISVPVDFESYDPTGYGKVYQNINFGLDSWGSPCMKYARSGPSPIVYYFNTNSWTDEQYRTIKITSEPDNSDFIAWLKENAEKQEVEPHPSLSVIAIDTEPSSTLEDIRKGIEDAGFDYTNMNFVQLSGYISELLAIRFNWYGGDNYRIECSLPLKMVLIGSGTNYDVYDVVNTRISTFLASQFSLSDLSHKIDSVVGEMVGTWIFNDEIPLDDLGSGRLINFLFVWEGTIYEGIGIGSRTIGPGVPALVFNTADSDYIVYHSANNYGFTPGWLDESYKRIVILEQPTDEVVNTWIKANATVTKETLETESQTTVGAINEVNAKTLDKAIQFDTYAQDDSGVGFGEHGVYWGNYLYIETEAEDIETDYYARVPIVAGDNVTFTVDEDNQVVKINATGGGSGVSFPLPRIRFANFKKVEDEETGDITYRFTIENLGGGTLREGDKLQICCRRSYPGGKQKLRCMAGYDVTEEDLNYRFLKIEVDPSDEDVQKWLFRNDHAKGYKTMSPMYFRLKRATAWNDSGEECNAIFSNVEQVWKTYKYNKSLYGGADIKSLSIK